MTVGIFVSLLWVSTWTGVSRDELNYWHGVLKSGCDCLGILTDALFVVLQFCVKCLQKQSIVRAVTKETWEERFGFAVATGESGVEE